MVIKYIYIKVLNGEQKNKIFGILAKTANMNIWEEIKPQTDISNIYNSTSNSIPGIIKLIKTTHHYLH